MVESSSIKVFDIDKCNVDNYMLFGMKEQNGFLLCKQGYIVLHLENKRYKLTPGSIFVFPAYSQTKTEEYSDDIQTVFGVANFDYVLNSLETLSDTQSHLFIRFNPLLSLSDLQLSRISEIIEQVRQRAQESTMLSQNIVSTMVSTFCLEVIDAFVTNNSMSIGIQSRSDKIFTDFLLALSKHFRKERNVAYYASVQSLTPRYFSSLIHATSGKTPLQWITLFVVNEAKRLLSTTKLSVKEISAVLNFPEQSFFGRYFKQYAGCSPLNYRNSLSKE